MVWLYVPALVLMLLYGLAWFVLGMGIMDENEGGMAPLLIWIAMMVIFGYSMYTALVEGLAG